MFRTRFRPWMVWIVLRPRTEKMMILHNIPEGIDQAEEEKLGLCWHGKLSNIQVKFRSQERKLSWLMTHRFWSSRRNHWKPLKSSMFVVVVNWNRPVWGSLLYQWKKHGPSWRKHPVHARGISYARKGCELHLKILHFARQHPPSLAAWHFLGLRSNSPLRAVLERSMWDAFEWAKCQWCLHHLETLETSTRTKLLEAMVTWQVNPDCLDLDVRMHHLLQYAIHVNGWPATMARIHVFYLGWSLHCLGLHRWHDEDTSKRQTMHRPVVAGKLESVTLIQEA